MAESHFNNYGNTDYLQGSIESILKCDPLIFNEFQMEYLEAGLRLLDCEDAAAVVRSDFIRAKHLFERCQQLHA